MSKKWTVNEYKIPETDIKYYSIPNFEIESDPDLPFMKVEGNSFIVDTEGYQYYHLFQDKIGQYELLKRYIKDLKIVLVGSNDYAYPPIDKWIGSLVWTDALSIYDIKKEDIVFLNKTNVWFEQTFYANKIFNRFLPTDLPGNNLYGLDDEDNYFKFNVEIAKIIRDIYLNIEKQKTLKVFVSRKELNNEIRKMKELIEKKSTSELSIEEEKLLTRMMRVYGTEDKHAERIIEQRFLKLEDEIKLEDYFVSKGYTVIDPYDMTFNHQVDLFSRVTHVAAIRGSGLYNTIFCKPETNVFILDTSNKYNFEYKTIVEVGAKNVYEIPVSSKQNPETPPIFFSVDNIIRLLENHYLDRL
jgi:hypothetical protein